MRAPIFHASASTVTSGDAASASSMSATKRRTMGEVITAAKHHGKGRASPAWALPLPPPRGSPANLVEFISTNPDVAIATTLRIGSVESKLARGRNDHD